MCLVTVKNDSNRQSRRRARTHTENKASYIHAPSTLPLFKYPTSLRHFFLCISLLRCRVNNNQLRCFVVSRIRYVRLVLPKQSEQEAHFHSSLEDSSLGKSSQGPRHSDGRGGGEPADRIRGGEEEEEEKRGLSQRQRRGGQKPTSNGERRRRRTPMRHHRRRAAASAARAFRIRAFSRDPRCNHLMVSKWG